MDVLSSNSGMQLLIAVGFAVGLSLDEAAMSRKKGSGFVAPIGEETLAPTSPE